MKFVFRLKYEIGWACQQRVVLEKEAMQGKCSTATTLCQAVNIFKQAISSWGGPCPCALLMPPPLQVHRTLFISKQRRTCQQQSGFKEERGNILDNLGRAATHAHSGEKALKTWLHVAGGHRAWLFHNIASKRGRVKSKWHHLTAWKWNNFYRFHFPSFEIQNTTLAFFPFSHTINPTLAFLKSAWWTLLFLYFVRFKFTYSCNPKMEKPVQAIAQVHWSLRFVYSQVFLYSWPAPQYSFLPLHSSPRWLWHSFEDWFNLCNAMPAWLLVAGCPN